jgi:hypothetical protein
VARQWRAGGEAVASGWRGGRGKWRRQTWKCERATGLAARHARQYDLVKSTITGMISTRPIHMRAHMISFDAALNDS